MLDQQRSSIWPQPMQQKYLIPLFVISEFDNKR